MSLLLLTLLILSPVRAGEPYPLTVAALRDACSTEERARQTYLAYSSRARAEGFKELEVIFHGLAESEGIHAANAGAVLRDLGGACPQGASPGIPAGATKENLRAALDAELREIDKGYPELIARAAPEKHAAGLRVMTESWKSESLHRDLLVKGRRYTGALFGMLVRLLDRFHPHVFVCGACGACAFELPKSSCPVCGRPASSYRESLPAA